MEQDEIAAEQQQQQPLQQDSASVSERCNGESTQPRCIRNHRASIWRRHRQHNSSAFYTWSSIQHQDTVSVKNLFKAFANNTTAHGIRQLAAADSWYRRLAWAALIACVTVCVVTHLAMEIRYYYTYPINVQTSFLIGQFEFPDVTVCDPRGPIRKNFSLKGDKEQRGSQQQHILTSNEAAIVLPQLFWGKQQQMDSSRFFLSHFIDLPASGLLPADYIVFCRYQNIPCSFLNFSVYYHHDFMNCFVFRPPTRKVAAAGPDGGLMLVLNVPQRAAVESFSGFGETLEEALLPMGLRVTLQQEGTIPHPSESGWVLPKAMLTEISAWHFRSTLINSPLAPCSGDSRKLQHFNHAAGKMQKFNYRTEDCVYHQLLIKMQQICNCSIGSEAATSDTQADSGERLQHCHQPFRVSRNFVDILLKMRRSQHGHDGQSSRQANALLAASSRSMKNVAECFRSARASPVTNCRNPCSFENYVTAISQAMWPQAEILPRLREKLVEAMSIEYVDAINSSEQQQPLWPLRENFLHRLIQLRRCGGSSQCADEQHAAIFDFMRNNFLELRVFPRSLDVQFTEEKTGFPLSSLLSQLGGVSGLWLGVSIVTGFEVLEFAAALMRKVLPQAVCSYD